MNDQGDSAGGGHDDDDDTARDPGSSGGNGASRDVGGERAPAPPGARIVHVSVGALGPVSERPEHRGANGNGHGGARPLFAQPTSLHDDELSEEQAAERGLIGPVPSRSKAREWALVLQSMGLSYAMFHSSAVLSQSGGGWLLRVAPHDRARALVAIEAYETENEGWHEVERDVPRHSASLLVPFAFAALAVFFAVTGPSAQGSFWFARGTADASQLASAPWRMVTALTLHGDLPHVLGNVVSGSIFGAILSRRLGPGAALLGMVVAASLGNALNAVHHLGGHLSIGASTAVFAAVGMLAGTQVLLGRDKRPLRERGMRAVLAPVVGGLALLGSLGASPETDLWAHFYGLLAGLVLGLAAGLVERRRHALESSRTG
ncbi:MAG: rhomboid family intramembrane serine protease, partial [Polyangiaceae bacterium]|nr:rhomboid family intramembrane serine protease [Polyangiaceae bacterium]